MGAQNFRLVDNSQIVPVMTPKDYNGLTPTDVYVSLKNYNAATILIQAGAIAGGQAAVTLLQATAIAGTSSKALAFDKMFTSTAAADSKTQVTVTSNTFNANTASTLYQIEIKADDLDVTNGFDCIAIHTVTSANSNFFSAMIILTHPRYAQAITPSAIID